jgi:hypothetical protein
MKDNDNILLENLYMKSKGILLKEQSGDIFNSDVNLSVYLEGEEDIESPRDVHVEYRIEVEYRSYGIKEINVSFVSCDSFNIEKVTLDENGNQSMVEHKIDVSSLENVETNFSVGVYGSVFPKNLVVNLRKETDKKGNEVLIPASAKLYF